MRIQPGAEFTVSCWFVAAGPAGGIKAPRKARSCRQEGKLCACPHRLVGVPPACYAPVLRRQVASRFDAFRARKRSAVPGRPLASPHRPAGVPPTCSQVESGVPDSVLPAPKSVRNSRSAPGVFPPPLVGVPPACYPPVTRRSRASRIRAFSRRKPASNPLHPHPFSRRPLRCPSRLLSACSQAQRA
jgi:hypothetical protein